MAPQTDYEEGTSFYGAVEIAPKMEERLTNRSKTLKLLVGLAFIAVALTAAVFAFTSPVATRSVEAVIDSDSPHFNGQTCVCKSNCVNEPGYGKEGVCETTKATVCKDFLGQDSATCTTDQVALLGGVAATNLCASCDMVVGANSCWTNPCQNGGLCADRAKEVGSVTPDGQLGYHCHCKFGWTGDTCSVESNFCNVESRLFCDNGKFDHVCKEDDDCANVFQAGSDLASLCTIVGEPVCHANAACAETTEGIKRTYSCGCSAGYSGDGYPADQKLVAFGSVLKAATDGVDCLKVETRSTALVYDAANNKPKTPSYGWLERTCATDADTFVDTGCKNINGCTLNCPDGNTGKTLSTEDCAAQVAPPGPCQNGATCEDTYDGSQAGTFKCKCPIVEIGEDKIKTALFDGEFCATDINECKGLFNPCGAQATCTNLNPNAPLGDTRAKFGYKCTCNTGWVTDGYKLGKFLGCKDEDDCKETNCKNGGTCRNVEDGSGNWECLCNTGWEGNDCSVDVDECTQQQQGDQPLCPRAAHMSCFNMYTSYVGAPEDAAGLNLREKHNKQGYMCTCDEHYVYDQAWSDTEIKNGKPDAESKNTCVDYDDCQDGVCSNAATCTNNGNAEPNDWTCICAAGWKGDNCDQDIDECEYVHTVASTGDKGNKVIDEKSEVDKMHNCLEEAQCENTDGSWNCLCLDGYYGNGVDFCTDIDDCARHETSVHFCTTDMRKCTTKADCGSGFCRVTFSDGYAADTITRCDADTDCANSPAILEYIGGSSILSNVCYEGGTECTDNKKLTRDAYPRSTTHELDVTKTHVHATAGYSSHQTTKFISPAVWVLDEIVFDKTGEIKVHQCGYMTDNGEKRASWKETGQCVDTGVNAFECVCDEGWTDSNCDVDVAECQLGIDNCDRNAKCKETDGSFFCECARGYADADVVCREAKGKDVSPKQDHLSLCGLSCADIDDCIGGTGKCVHGVCRDLGADAFKCTCNVGYTDFKCDADINECGLMTDDCDDRFAECTNLPGSWSCECKDGYVGTGKEGGCTAIDDCAQSPCEHGTCTDVGNAYVCECEAGWKDKHCDKDENECLQSSAIHDCHADGKCVNTPGSYYCRCVSGFQGDGYTCMDLDDCDPDPCGMKPEAETPRCRAQGATSLTAVYTCDDTPAEDLGCKDVGANSFQCQVCPGYSADRGMAPVDVNECKGVNECSANAICENTAGSYNCECKANHYDPCVCENEVSTFKPETGKCPVCTLEGSDELCIPGRECVKCTDCKGGTDNSASVYACPDDANLVEVGRAYFPADPQFDGGRPTNPGRQYGAGFKIKENNMCVHSDYTCVNINECDELVMLRKSITQYSGKGCAPKHQANCIDECGTARCECTGGCFAESNMQCYFGDGETCQECLKCKAHECESAAPTTTTNRKCAALIPDGKYAVETTSGHTAQCLVMWSENQKVFPERYNWGGESTDRTEEGMDVADLCENPICGVCGYSGKTAEKNIIDGGTAVWVFRHLQGEEYLIMSAMGSGGYRCLGFRAPGAPYPELLTWKESTIFDATGACEVGKCQKGEAGATLNDGMCWADRHCVGDGNSCVLNKCSNEKECGKNVGLCTTDTTDDTNFGKLCLLGKTGSAEGETKSGSNCPTCELNHGLDKRSGTAVVCTSGVTGCEEVALACSKKSSTQGMWVNNGAKGSKSPLEYFCGLEGATMVSEKKAVTWRIRALGQQAAASGSDCHSAKVCSLAKYKSLFVIESQARGFDYPLDYECLQFKDGDFSNQANPTLASSTGSEFACGLTEEALIAEKSSVWKLIALEE